MTSTVYDGYPEYLCRFRNIDTKTGCWNWTAHKVDKGYGRIWFKRKRKLVHRLAFELTFGISLPDSLKCCHSCDNPACFNPDHLWIGTDKDNVLDRVIKGRSARLGGDKNGSHKLTRQQVEEIRCTRIVRGTRSEMARAYGVCKNTIGNVLNFTTWRQ